jgi:gluconate 2-dehydrogenase gamma chain
MTESARGGTSPGVKPSRRELLKALAMGAAASSVVGVIPAHAAEYAHHLIAAEKAATNGYAPKFFGAHEYKTLQGLCQSIIPPDADAGGAVEAGAPEFIDLLTSENTEYQRILGGGLLWLDATCSDRYQAVFLDCSAAQQKKILDQIAYLDSAVSDPGLSQATQFFSLLRNMTADGFFTSQIGIEYLGYIGSTFLKEFPGCPPVPGV